MAGSPSVRPRLLRGFVSRLADDGRRRDMTTVLHANDEVHCLHCQRWHPVQQENVGRTPAENLYRYVSCGGQLFYVGTPSRWPTRQSPIWTVMKDPRWLETLDGPIRFSEHAPGISRIVREVESEE